jgi:hypothetical protein
MLLLTDGTVMAQGDDTISWYQLKPDIHGSYVNGTWSTLAAMNDTRLYNSMQVLRDGRVFVAGAEYGTGGSTAEVFDPVTNTWTLAPSSGQTFNDSVSELLGDGRVLVAPVSPAVTRGTVIYDPATNTWSAGPVTLRRQDEVPWLKLPDGSILSVDGTSQAERFIPALNQWVADANTPDVMFIGNETGCGHMLANGTAFFRGYSHTAVYTPSGSTAPGTWAAGPDIPSGLNCGDSPGAVLPNSHVLFAAGPGYLTGPPSFFEYDPVANSIAQVNGPTGTNFNSAPYTITMLTLPDGGVLMKAGSAVYEYVSTSGTADTTFKPAITGINRNLDGSHHLTGTNLNGFTEGAAYGDDFQMATNYPLVRLTDGAGNVYFARTSNWSSTALQTGAAVQSTEFTLPPDAPDGSYALAVIASGIASAPVTLMIPDTAGDTAPTLVTPAVATPGNITGKTTALSVLGADSDSGGEPSLTYTWTTTSAPSGVAAPSMSSNSSNAAKNTTATFYQAGSYTLMVTIRDIEGLSVSSSVSVAVSQTLSSVVVVPGTTNLAAGQTLQLSATGLDQFGLPMVEQPTFTWAVAAGGGSVSSEGMYIAPGGGTLASVSATAGTCSAATMVAVISAPWISADIGSPVLTGTAYDSGGGTITLSAAGSGIAGNADQFHYAYRYLCGDGMITARVASQLNTADGTLAGVMIRASSETGAAQAMMAMTPGLGAVFQFRTATNLSSVNSYSNGLSTPYWVRLVRRGNTVTGYTAPDGMTWTQQGAANILMPGAAVLMGLVVASTDAQTVCTATFDNIFVLAAQNDELSVTLGGTGMVNVLANDTGPAGATLMVSSYTQGALGTVVDTGGGVLQYTPQSGATADTDSFTYTVSDGLGDSATATVVINGVLAWYKFDEGSGTVSADATGNGHICTLNGTAWTTGIQGTGALSCAGTSSTAGIPALNLNTNTLTITGWVRRSGTQAPFAGLVFCRAGTTACGLHLGAANELRYTWNNASATYDYNSGLTVPDAQWTFVALVITPVDATLYLQPQGGTLRSAVNPVENVVEAFDGVTTLGQDPGSSTRCYLGALDEVRIYNTPLSMDKIAALAIATPTVASAAAAVPATVTSTNTALSVLGGSTVLPESALSYTWAVTTLPAGAPTPAFTVNGTHAARNTRVLFTQAGDYIFTVTIADTSGSMTSSSVAVTVNQTLTYVNVTPGTPAIGTQITQQFTAAAQDQFGNNLAAQPTFIWNSTGYGSVNSDGLYTTPYASGAASVTASYSGVSSANIAVTASSPWKTWVTSTFSADEAQDPKVSGPLANPAGDGISNLLKYAFNADPKAVTPNLLPVLAVDGDHITFTYQRNNAAYDLTYVVERSQDLTTWTTVTPSTTVLSDDGFTSLLQAAFPRGAATKLLLRLRVVTP